MSDDKISIWLHCNMQDLQDLIDWSSKRFIRDEVNMAKYFKDFWSLTCSLLYFDYLSESKCHKLFLQGFHPKDHAKITPDLERQFQDIM